MLSFREASAGHAHFATGLAGGRKRGTGPMSGPPPPVVTGCSRRPRGSVGSCSPGLYVPPPCGRAHLQ